MMSEQGMQLLHGGSVILKLYRLTLTLSYAVGFRFRSYRCAEEPAPLQVSIGQKVVEQ